MNTLRLKKFISLYLLLFSCYSTFISLTVLSLIVGTSVVAQEETLFEIESAMVVKKSGFALSRIEFPVNAENTFVGTRAGSETKLLAFPTGWGNSFFGHESGKSNETGLANTIIGSYSGWVNREGNRNTFVGTNSGLRNTDSDNTYIGFNAGESIDSGEDNTIIGSNAGWHASEGSRNVFIGSGAGDFISQTPSSGNVMIGYQSGIHEAGNYKLYIESSSSMDPLIYGDFDRDEMTIHGQLGINIKQPDSELHIYHAATNGGGSTGLRLENSGVNNNWWNFYTVNSSGNLILFSKAGGSSSVGAFDDVSGVYTPTADMRFKKNIEILSDVIKDVKKVSIKKYQFKSQEDTGKKYVGVLAQQIIDLFPEVVHYDEEYDKYRVDYSSLSVIALKAIQEQQEQIELLIKNQKYMQDQIDKINQN